MAGRRRPDPRIARARRAALDRARKTIQDLATAGECSWRFAKYWVEDEKTSAKLEAIFLELTGEQAA